MSPFEIKRALMVADTARHLYTPGPGEEEAARCARALSSAVLALCDAGVKLKLAGLKTGAPELEAIRGVIRMIDARRHELRLEDARSQPAAPASKECP